MHPPNTLARIIPHDLPSLLAVCSPRRSDFGNFPSIFPSLEFNLSPQFQSSRQSEQAAIAVSTQSPSEGTKPTALRMRQVEGREWWLWGSAVAVTLVLTFGILSLTFPGFHLPTDTA